MCFNEMKLHGLNFASQRDGKTGVPSGEKKTSWSRVESQQTLPIYDAKVRESNPDHICGRRGALTTAPSLLS